MVIAIVVLPLLIVFQVELALLFSPDMAMLTAGLKTRSLPSIESFGRYNSDEFTRRGHKAAKGLVHCEKRLRISGLFSSLL